LHATQARSGGQATECFKVFGYAETAKSFVWRSHGSPWSRYNSLVPPVSQSVRLKVLFFGRLKDVVSHAEDSLDFAEASTIEQLFAFYSARVPELAKYRSSVVASRNQEFAAWDTLLHSGDEVAFLPPVSGG
jgi:sulfur-carrier protein